jgi:hypothetical protein
MSAAMHETLVSRRRAILGTVASTALAAGTLGATAYMSPAIDPDPDGELLALWERSLKLQREIDKAVEAVNAAETDAEERDANEAFYALDGRIAEEQAAIEDRVSAIGTASTVAGAAVLLRFGLMVSGHDQDIADHYVRDERDVGQFGDDRLIWQALFALDRLAVGAA